MSDREDKTEREVLAHKIIAWTAALYAALIAVIQDIAPNLVGE